jgi:hypothetical protein
MQQLDADAFKRVLEKYGREKLIFSYKAVRLQLFSLFYAILRTQQPHFPLGS